MFRKWISRQAYRQYRDTLLLWLNPQLLKRRRFAFLGELQNDFGHNAWVEPEFLIAQKLAQRSPTKIFCDIGANKGVYEYVISQIIPEKLIYAFEPIPQLNGALKKMFPDVNVSSYAMSDSVQQLEFKIPYLNGARMWTRATLKTEFKENDETNFDLIKVQTYTLDRFVIENKLEHISLIKIDVEGNELAVLKGGEETLKKLHPDLVIEIEQRHHPDMPITEIIQYILDLGYRGAYFDPAAKKLKLIESLDNFVYQDTTVMHSASYINNFVFLANSRKPDDVVSSLNADLFSDIVTESS